MSDPRFTAAQKGISLAQALPYRSGAEAQLAQDSHAGTRSAKAKVAPRGAEAGKRTAAAGPAISTLPTPAVLSTAERLRILVYFKRVSPGSAWAADVVPASNVDSLLKLAGLSSGFTHEARTVVLRSASKFIAETRAAPTPAHARKHLALAKEKMSAVAALATSDGHRVGVAAVRKALA